MLKYLGFCGSLTSFSGWQLDIFFSWINEGRSHRNGLRDVCLHLSPSLLEAHASNQAVDGIGKVFFTLSISMASLFLGIHIGTTLLPVIPKPRPLSSAMQYAVPIISVFVYGATFPAYFCLTASFRHQATAALLFSFPGTLTRYVLSILLNPRSKVLPVGTLVVNEFGTSLLAMFHALQGLRPPVSPGACSILQGLDDGYCGCLTTVSTFVSEMRLLGSRKGVLYGTISIVVGQVLVVLVLGSAVWTGSVSSQISCTPIL
jgi:fluoride ion exporter CrcB/FEX